MKFQTPRGTRDFLPKDMIKRQFVLDKIRSVFELWGFDPLETPAFEEWALLAAKSGGGEAIKEEVYHFKDKSDRELGLRFDLTVPTARVVASNPNIPRPFKRYQIGSVWRYDRPGTGRYREFTQADVDIFGSVNMDADALIISAACNCLKELGFKNFTVRISNRKLIEDLVISLGIDEKNVIDVFRSIDKLDKIGEDGVRGELTKKGIDSSAIKKLMKILLSDLESLESKVDLKGLNEIKDKVNEFGYDNAKIDLSLVRGLEYYTGTVFEIVLPDSSMSVAGGGRYDRLIELYGGKPTPAIGISLGIERIIEIMNERNMFNLSESNTKIFLVSITDSTKIRRQMIRLSALLRGMNIANEFDIMSRSLSKQLDYINSRKIPYAIIIGERELDKNMVKMKNMTSGEERELSIAIFEKDVERILAKDLSSKN